MIADHISIPSLSSSSSTPRSLLFKAAHDKPLPPSCLPSPISPLLPPPLSLSVHSPLEKLQEQIDAWRLEHPHFKNRSISPCRCGYEPVSGNGSKKVGAKGGRWAGRTAGEEGRSWPEYCREREGLRAVREYVGEHRHQCRGLAS